MGGAGLVRLRPGQLYAVGGVPNSPSRTAVTKESQATGVSTRAGPVLSLESRTATVPGRVVCRASSTQLLPVSPL